MAPVQPGSVLADEVARFNDLAAKWWDPAGPMRPLHAMNPVRVEWIDSRVLARFGSPQRVLDLGCGAGLAAEALAARGHAVLGLDAAPEVIGAARAHAEDHGVEVDYRVGAAEDLLAEGARFPVITALEVIEHVADPAAFLRLLAGLVEPGGLVFLSTLNRTLRSLAVAKIGAEYVLRMLPAGTHDWRRFVTPAELGRLAAAAGLRLAETSGLLYDLRTGAWRTGRDLAVNYLAMLSA